MAGSATLYPMLEALVKAIMLAKIGTSNFAAIRLASLGLSANLQERATQSSFSQYRDWFKVKSNKGY
ncbi:hypothetical protein HZ326_18578 [Fusarium oxysporum f. sp. albedinis]|nr:hypothetical protein HZ326_23424 [Fusarium oxysporum f. sp. albedinis]KAJ0138460.1 hypothetical protein HZ326_18578 [Fusarium oxysporum f. sp. albedinis]